MPRGLKGELDLVGYDGEALAFVEVRTRTVREELSALPELSVATDKQRMVIRTASDFWRNATPRMILAALMFWRSTTIRAGRRC
jgi:Holliday junction resolvase-like predicted endonuclease